MDKIFFIYIAFFLCSIISDSFAHANKQIDNVKLYQELELIKELSKKSLAQTTINQEQSAKKEEEEKEEDTDQVSLKSSAIEKSEEIVEETPKLLIRASSR